MDDNDNVPSASDGVNSKPEVKAPTYSELIELTCVLHKKVEVLETASSAESLKERTPKEQPLRTPVECRALPDVDRSIPMFMGL